MMNYGEKPVVNIGFPLKYYYQFWTRGSDSPNHGFVLRYLLIDFAVIWLVALGIYSVVQRQRKRN